MIGLDTCFLIDFFNGDPGARTIIEQSSDVCICERPQHLEFEIYPYRPQCFDRGFISFKCGDHRAYLL